MVLLKMRQSKGGQSQAADRWIFGTMLGAAIVGLLASFVLTVEKFHLLTDPGAILACSVNLVLNCATVMQTPQASVFGFPNSLLGIVGFSVVITVAVSALTGSRFSKGYLRTAQVFYGLGLIFAYWLFFQSVFVIQVLCPWCLFVTVVTTLVFEALLRYNLRENTFDLDRKLHKRVLGWLAKDYDKLAVAAWLFAMVVLVVVRFGDGLFA